MVEPTETLLPTTFADDAPNLAARLEALQKLLDKARHDDDPSDVESETAAPSAPMPKFLHGQDHDAPQSPQEQQQSENWREKLDLLALAGRERGQWIFLGATVAASAALLVGLEYGDKTDARAQRPTATVIADVAPTPPEVRLNFMGEMRCDQQPCDALSSAIPRAIATLPVKASETASPGIVYASHTDMAINDPSALNPLDQVSVTGLPDNVRLSVGQKISDGEWTLAAGDLNDIRIIVPDAQTEPVKANIEIRRKIGTPIASIGLTIEREEPAMPSFSDPLLSMAPIDPPAEAEESEPVEAKADTDAAATPEPETAAVPAKPAKPAKAKVARQKKTKPQQAPVIQQAAETPKPPATLLEGLLSPAPKQASAPSSSTPKSAYTDDNSPPSYPPPTTTLANEPAGFEILRGLGGGFGLAPQ